MNALFPPDERTARRAPPASVEIEQALLGAILVDNRAWEKVGEFLRPEHFADEAHGRIYEAATKMLERGQQASPATLRRAFQDDAALQDVGGAKYLAELAATAFNIIDAEDYGRTIADLATRRAAIRHGEELLERLYSGDVDSTAASIVEAHEEALYGLMERHDTVGSGPRRLVDFTDQALQRIEEAQKREGVTGISTGLRDLDAIVAGLQRAAFIVLAGRPGMGKSVILSHFAMSAGSRPHPEAPDRQASALVFGLEMSGEETAQRELAAGTGISADDLRRGQVSQHCWATLLAERERHAKVSIWIDDTPALTMHQIRQRARRHKRRHGLDLVLVDYLQLIRFPKVENRFQEISEISRGLKALAKELDCPVVAAAQLSRKVEEREDKRPILSDLRESGQIEQDADLVIFAYREEYYHARRKPEHQRDGEDPAKFSARLGEWHARAEQIKDTAELIVAKQRNGPTGTAHIFCDLSRFKLGDLHQQHSFGGEAPF